MSDAESTAFTFLIIAIFFVWLHLMARIDNKIDRAVDRISHRLDCHLDQHMREQKHRDGII